VSGATTGPEFEYYRDWVKYDTSAATAGTAISAAYAKSTAVSWDPTHTLYFSGGLCKVELALARGKAKHDKREAMAERDAKREAERIVGRRIKGW